MQHKFPFPLDVLLNGEEDALDVEIHDLVPSVLLFDLVKIRPPRGTSIRKQDIHMICMLLYLFDQAFNLGNLGTVGWDSVGPGTGLLVGQRIQGSNSFVACAGFAARDEDLGASGLE